MKEQVILIYGGLRGAVAFSLAILIDYNHLGNDGESTRKILITATLFIILVTVGFMGLTMKPLVRLFKVKLAGEKSLSLFGDLNNTLLDHTLAGVEAIIGSNGRNRAREFCSRLDDKHFRRWLQRDPETHDQKIIKTYEKIALKLHYASIHPAESSSYLRDLPESLRRQHMTASESMLTLPSIVTATSDLNLQEFFVRHSVSAASLPSKDTEDNHKHRHHGDRRRAVHFDADAGEEKEGVEVTGSFSPNWRRRTSLYNEGRDIEDFQDTFRDVMKAKTRVLKESRQRHSKTPMDLETRLNTLANQRIPTREELSKSRETVLSEVANEDEHNRDTVEYENDSDDSGEPIVIPKKDYPQNNTPSDKVNFDLGGEQL
ncbi:unnamed protein product [Dibothriocephalus latus]|uniref:Cation/H+ exchanger domain-containing protein n=1 Tax=Dibothriocephalus latus TaxID=60516 RepID=A0A3P6QKB5_DIBLA|nr:unnamed protein product [Dibothriocephalus latus]